MKAAFHPSRSRYPLLLVRGACRAAWLLIALASPAAEETALLSAARERGARGDLQGAAEAYRRVVETASSRPALCRTARTELAEVLLDRAEALDTEDADALLEEARTLCRRVQLGGGDRWYARSLVTWARIMLLRDQTGEAVETLLQHRPLFRRLEAALDSSGASPERHPSAGAWTIQGRSHEKEAAVCRSTQETAERLCRALRAYLTACAGYPGSVWADEARRGAERVRGRLTAMGREVSVSLGAYTENLAEAAYARSDRAFLRESYDTADRHYEKALVRWPEAAEVPAALGNFAVCRVHKDRPNDARAAIRYLAERFGRRPETPRILLRTAVRCRKLGAFEPAIAACRQFAAEFPEHPQHPAALLTLGTLHHEAGSWPAAARVWGRLCRTHPDCDEAGHALRALAWESVRRRDHQASAEWLGVLARRATNDAERLRARLARGEARSAAGQHAAAAESFAAAGQLARRIGSPDAGKAALRQAAALVLADEKPEAVKVLLDAARDDRGTPEASTALRRAGCILLDSGEAGQALEVFDRLLASRPDSTAARRARVPALRAALETGSEETLRPMVEKLAGDAKNMEAAEGLEAARMLADHGRHECAVKLFRAVRTGTGDADRRAAALYGEGEALLEAGRFGAAAARLGELLAEYPRFHAYARARFLQGRACSASGDRAAAETAYLELLSRVRDAGWTVRASFHLAEVQSQPGERLASYQRVVLLGDPADPEQRPWIGRALLESARLMLELKRYDAAAGQARRYLEIGESPSDRETAASLLREAEAAVETAS
ncbi:tetratricopeptide repeat protein [Kiritimatiella glycovorans]|uniref:Tol-pal system protein YbgF n=1 Tax=Kiritimatiella glycovorans TaxID=1307763 RepID=A0A0G3EF25_9BACT|nr:tetratricopeptide repeat protein [Kiritimatiella glycovorans]AKJ63370.1 tol-pal system protein YbgF [Kiritimatiella glycovorans]